MDTTFKLQEEWHRIIPYQVAILEYKMQTRFPVQSFPLQEV